MAGTTYKRKEYQSSDALKQIEAELEQQAGRKPGDYTSRWQEELDGILEKIENREAFHYDVNDDALYQHYKDQYVHQGKLAMMDTMGQAAALTGGYGNSYAQQAGQQAYQGYLQGLNDIVPELYRMALERYTREGQDLYDRYALVSDRELQDYGRYSDALDAWGDDYDRQYRAYADARDQEYERYLDSESRDYREYQDEYDRAEAAAKLMAEAGDYSLLAELYGLSEAQLKKLLEAAQPAKGGGSSRKKTETAELGSGLLAGAVISADQFFPQNLKEQLEKLRGKKE